MILHHINPATLDHLEEITTKFKARHGWVTPDYVKLLKGETIIERPIIAVFTAEQTENTERIKVMVQEFPSEGTFEVFVDGGLMADGSESSMHASLRAALQAAAEEISVALGER